MNNIATADWRLTKPACTQVLAVLIVVSGLNGCASARGERIDPAPAPSRSMARFESERYGIVFDYPQRLDAAHAFEADYFLGRRWNPDVAANIPGAALLSLTLPESNDITRAVVRVGASDDTRAIDVCQSTPGSEEAKRVRLRGVDFVRMDHENAAMNHYSRVHSYRGVHDDQCVAIDLIVTGTNPDVYGAEKPPKPPFDVDDGMARLEGLLDGLVLIETR